MDAVIFYLRSCCAAVWSRPRSEVVYCVRLSRLLADAVSHPLYAGPEHVEVAASGPAPILGTKEGWIANFPDKVAVEFPLPEGCCVPPHPSLGELKELTD